MDTTSLTKRLKIEIDGWPSLGGLEVSKEGIRNIKERWNLGPKEDIIKAFRRFFMGEGNFDFFLQTMLST